MCFYGFFWNAFLERVFIMFKYLIKGVLLPGNDFGEGIIFGNTYSLGQIIFWRGNTGEKFMKEESECWRERERRKRKCMLGIVK